MAFDLTAVIRLRDDISGKMRRITQVTENLNRTTSKLSGGVQRFSGAMANAGRSINNQVNSLGGLKSGLLGVAGAYVSARVAASLFQNTIGEAAKFEASTVAVDAIFNDKKASTAYMEMVDKMAIDSPLLNSTEMLANSKGLVAMTKNIGELEKSWGIVEKLMVLDPTQGTEGAVFALKEMFQGDALSMVERFGLNKTELNRIKKLSIPQQIAEINALLDGMGVTESAINRMGQTTLGYWAQIGERADKFKRLIGASSNTKLGEVLGDIVDKLDAIDMGAIAGKVDAVLGSGVQKLIDFGKAIWKMRKPITAVAKTVGVFVGAVAGIAAVVKTFGLAGAAIGFIMSPLGLAAAVVTGLVFAFQQAYKKSETFRNGIAKVGDSAKRAVDFVMTIKEAFMSLYYDTGEVSDLLKKFGLSKESASKAAGFMTTVYNGFKDFFNRIKTGAGEFVAWLGAKWQEIQPGVQILIDAFSNAKDVAIDIFTTLWNLLQPILSKLGIAFNILADVAVLVFNNVITPVVSLVWTTFQTLWAIVSPILDMLGTAIEVAFDVLNEVWKTVIKPVSEYLLGEFKTALESVQPILDGIGGSFDWLGGKISSATEWFKKFTGNILNFKPPEWLLAIGGKVAGALGIGAVNEASKGHYHGLTRVPYDGYLARLHKGEMVLPRQEADAYRSLDGLSYESMSAGIGVVNNEYHGNTRNGGDTTINVTVNYQGGSAGNNEQDIDYIAKALALKIIQAMEAGV